MREPSPQARELFDRTLAAISVDAVMREQVSITAERLRCGKEEIDLTQFKRVLVVAIGKASLPMARNIEAQLIEAQLGERLTAGLVVTNAILGAPPVRLPVFFGAHPVPNQGSLNAAQAALALLREYDAPDTLVLFLLSGGGSAMFETPIDARISLSDLQTVNRVLVNCGAVIGEMNIVRRFLSAVKGGRLAAAAPQSRQISLYLSDVNDDDLATVSSGPTLPSDITPTDFWRVVTRYDLLHQFPPHLAELIKTNDLPGLPARTQFASERQSHHLLMDNRRALETAQSLAERDFGLLVEIAYDLVEAEIGALVTEHLARLERLRQAHPGRTVCLLSGGEAICPVRGKGQGGRNQEFALRAALLLAEQGTQQVAVLSAGTDGIDGNSPATGAVADATTCARAQAAGLHPAQHLAESNAFPLFQRLGDAIITGATGNNVRDLRILLARG